MSYEPENPTSDIGDDAQRWLFDEFTRISGEIALLSEEIAASTISSGYGGLIQTVAVTIPDITTGNWQTVPFDSGQVPTPINITQDPTNNRFSIDEEDRWFFTTYGVMTFDKENKDRYINWRIYDETAGAPYSPDPFPMPVENNSNFAQWSASALVEISETRAGHWLRLELGGSDAGDPFANITLEKAGLAIIRVPGPS